MLRPCSGRSPTATAAAPAHTHPARFAATCAVAHPRSHPAAVGSERPPSTARPRRWAPPGFDAGAYRRHNTVEHRPQPGTAGAADGAPSLRQDDADRRVAIPATRRPQSAPPAVNRPPPAHRAPVTFSGDRRADRHEPNDHGGTSIRRKLPAPPLGRGQHRSAGSFPLHPAPEPTAGAARRSYAEAALQGESTGSGTRSSAVARPGYCWLDLTGLVLAAAGTLALSRFAEVRT